MAHSAQEARDLAAVMSSVIHDVEKDLPCRRGKGPAVEIGVADLGARSSVESDASQSRQP